MTAFARIHTGKDAEKGATWHVEFDGEPLFAENGEPIEMDFLGLESDAARRAAAARIRKEDKKNRGQRKRRASTMSIQEMLAATDDTESARAEFYAALCTGWRHVTYIEDDKLDDPDAKEEILPHSQANAQKLFSTRTWLMEGIDAFLAEKSNFTREIVNS